MPANILHPIQPITDIFKALFPQEPIKYTFKGAYKGLIKEKNTALGRFNFDTEWELQPLNKTYVVVGSQHILIDQREVYYNNVSVTKKLIYFFIVLFITIVLITRNWIFLLTGGGVIISLAFSYFSGWFENKRLPALNIFCIDKKWVTSVTTGEEFTVKANIPENEPYLLSGYLGKNNIKVPELLIYDLGKFTEGNNLPFVETELDIRVFKKNLHGNLIYKMSIGIAIIIIAILLAFAFFQGQQFMLPFPTENTDSLLDKNISTIPEVSKTPIPKIVKIDNKDGGYAELRYLNNSVVASYTPQISAISWNSSSEFIGYMYQFLPENLKFSTPADLFITVPIQKEQNISIFKYNPDKNIYETLSTPISQEQTLAQVKVTELGTFAIGYDNTPPKIHLSSPENNEHLSVKDTYIFSGSVADNGVGVDQQNIGILIDDKSVPLKFFPGGEFQIRPSVPFSAGSHVIKITATDTMQNQSHLEINFIAE